MRGAVFSALLAGAAFASFSGCSGSQSQNAVTPLTAPASAMQRIVKPTHVRVPHDLYVAGDNPSVVYMFRNKTYRGLGVITNGINTPIDDFLDRQGNLYVANSSNVTEYAPGANSPSFTYSAGMTEPTSVAVDARGYVFEGDNNLANDGRINEYFQGFNEAFASCDTGQGAFPVGIAVDSAGDVFANVANIINGSNDLVEYPGGLGNCAGAINLMTLPGSEGMAIDAKNNLLVAAFSGAVDVIDPPYTSITGTIGSGFSAPVNVNLNKANTLAFVADVGNQTVTVVSYPGGSNITVLGTSNGLRLPVAAVDGPNFVP